MNLLIALLLSSWVYSPADTRTYSCPVECFKKLVSVKPLNCERVTLDVTIALRAFDKYGPLASPEVCEILGDHELWINQHDEVWEDWHRVVSGLYHADVKALELSRSMDALAHEMLHAIEYATLPESKRSEMGWDYVRNKPGTWIRNTVYQQVINYYEKHMKGLDRK